MTGERKVWQKEVKISTKKEGKEDNKETDKEIRKKHGQRRKE